MSKLSKQDKIEIYHLWHDYQIGSTELSQRYRVGRTNIGYLLALIDRHGLAIYGYRRITAELRRRGLLVNHKKSAALNEQAEIVWHSQ